MGRSACGFGPNAGQSPAVAGGAVWRVGAGAPAVGRRVVATAGPRVPPVLVTGAVPAGPGTPTSPGTTCPGNVVDGLPGCPAWGPRARTESLPLLSPDASMTRFPMR